MVRSHIRIARRSAAVALFFATSVAAQSVTLDASTTHQTIDGFGTTIAGYAGDGPFDTAAFESLYFDTLGASMARIELHQFALSGASPADPVDYKPTVAELSSEVRLGADVYDNLALFNFEARRLHQVAPVLRAAAAGRGGDGFKLIGSLWSTPYWMKGQQVSWFNGNPQVDGSGDPVLPRFTNAGNDIAGGSLIDTPDNLEQFGRYVAAYVKGVELEYGVPLHALSLQNEPVLAQSFNSTVYTPELLAKAILAVDAAFDAHNAAHPEDPILTRLVGPETANAGPLLNADGTPDVDRSWRQLQFIDSFRDFATGTPAADGSDLTGVLDALGAYSVHGYNTGGVDAAGRSASADWWGRYLDGGDYPAAFSNAGTILPHTTSPGVRADGKPLWLTEASGEHPDWLHTDADGLQDGALTVAVKIHEALVLGNHSAYLYWQAAYDPAFGNNDFRRSEALTIGTDAEAGKLAAAAHFFKYVRPGMVRAEAATLDTGVLVSAFVDPDTGAWTLVLINPTDAAETLSLDSGGAFGLSALTGVLSTEAAKLVALSDPAAGGSVSLPAYSVLTLTAVPEPAGAAVGLVGLLLATRRGGRRRRRA